MSEEPILKLSKINWSPYQYKEFDELEAKNLTHASIFDKYFSIRSKLKSLEGEERALKPLVVNAALNVFADSSDKTVYKGAQGSLGLRFRAAIPRNNADLQYLEELIQIENEDAERENAVAIAEIKHELDRLQAKMDNLRQTEKGRELIAEKVLLEEQLTYQEPIIALLKL